MPNTQPSLFTFPQTGQQLRITDLDGNPWFLGADVLQVLYGTPAGNARRYDSLDADEVRKVTRSHLGLPAGKPMVLVSEPGLYKLIQSSRRPEAKAFDRWVRHEVLPAIRKEGVYVMGEEKLRDPHLSLNELEAVQEQMIALLARKAELLEDRAAKAETALAVERPVADAARQIVLTGRYVTLRSYARKYDDINLQALPGALVARGLLYPSAKGYRVNRKTGARYFGERFSQIYDQWSVIMREPAIGLLQEMYDSGELPRKKRPPGRPLVIDQDGNPIH